MVLFKKVITIDSVTPDVIYSIKVVSGKWLVDGGYVGSGNFFI